MPYVIGVEALQEPQGTLSVGEGKILEWLCTQACRGLFDGGEVHI
jgi:hypothetical protein